MRIQARKVQGRKGSLCSHAYQHTCSKLVVPSFTETLHLRRSSSTSPNEGTATSVVQHPRLGNRNLGGHAKRSESVTETSSWAYWQKRSTWKKAHNRPCRCWNADNGSPPSAAENEGVDRKRPPPYSTSAGQEHGGTLREFYQVPCGPAQPPRKGRGA